MKIKLVLITALIFGFISCENQDNIVADFGSTSVFFPYQTPVRTIVQGEYDLGFNENDNNGRFEIGVVMSGVFENQVDRKVYFEYAPELIDTLAMADVDTINVQLLPSSYYTIEQQSPVTIPAGSVQGRIPVQLSDAFFDDALSYAEFGEVHYVLPLKITNAEGIDSILTGLPLADDPIKVRASDWNPAPKDYTLFGIKFMNKYQGTYLRRGVDQMTNVAGETVSTAYRNEYVVRDELVPLSTSGRNNVSLENIVRRGSLSSPGKVNFELAFDANGNCSISSFQEDVYNVSGTGKFVQDGDEWGGEKRDVIHLDYTYTDAANNETHAVKDTLVLRNRDVKFEEFTVEF